MWIVSVDVLLNAALKVFFCKAFRASFLVGSQALDLSIQAPTASRTSALFLLDTTVAVDLYQDHRIVVVLLGTLLIMEFWLIVWVVL